MTRPELHMEICKQMNEVYKKKNHDYGNSFKDTRDKVPNAILVRLLDKTNRLVQLLTKGDRQVEDESVKDTLMDLANYAIMELVEMEMDSTNTSTKILDKLIDLTNESTKPKFRLDDFKGKYVMYCDTEEKAKMFCNYLDSQGKKWLDGEAYKDNTLFEENHCYNFNEGCRGTKYTYEVEGYKFLEFDDFDWSKEEVNDRTRIK